MTLFKRGTQASVDTPRADEAYERHKQQAAERAAAASAKGREIGDIPTAKNPKLVEKCRFDLKLYLETFHADRFSLAWSPDHLKAIKKTQTAILEGGLFALAMPRGSGKTTIFECAVLWAILYGHHSFALLVQANQRLAKRSMANIKKMIDSNDKLLEHFPAAIFPFRKLQRIANRANGQTYMGQATDIMYGKECLIFANIPNCPAAGAILQCGGIKSAVRGANVDGKRPSLCLLDDPQTKASAKSEMQTDEREEIVAGDVLGLAGPDGNITALMACTVIAPGDPGCLAARMLNRKRHPEWQGERFQILYEWPSNMDLWREYRELIIDAQMRDCSPNQVRKIGDQFYRKHRDEMEAGARVAWPERKPGALSGLQFAMNLFFRDEAAFWAEYMNQPQARDVGDETMLTADEVARRVNAMPRNKLPLQAQHITAFVDVHKDLLYWVVCWWADDFTGGVLDYGTWPDQARLHFRLRDANPTLRKATGQKSVLAAVRAALDSCADLLLPRRWTRDGDGLEMQIERYGEDSGWGEATDTVFDHAREHAQKSIIRPSKGKGIRPTERQMSEYQVAKSDKAGCHWIRKTGTRGVRHMLVDSNYWKTFTHNGLNLPFEERHSISLYKAKPHEHKLFGEHCTAEVKKTVEHKGRSVDLWEVKPGKPDNHWFDCLCGCAVMASELGIELRTMPKTKTKPKGSRGKKRDPKCALI